MNEHVSAALFVYSQDNEKLVAQVQANTFGVEITPIAFKTLLQDTDALLEGVGHVMVSGPMGTIKTILQFSREYSFSVGIIPMDSQKNLKKHFDLPEDLEKSIDLALRKNVQVMDLILCNGKILLFKATIGRLPLLDSLENDSLWKVIFKIYNRLKGIRLLGFNFTTANNRKINTAACGCMIVQYHKDSFVSRLISHDNSFSDGMISLVVNAPLSILAYLRFLTETLRRSTKRNRIPSTIGYIKSSRIDITSERQLIVSIDGEPLTQTPLHCEVLPQAMRINVGAALCKKNKKQEAPKERVEIRNLPAGNELLKLKKKNIPIFAYASEERFRDLFMALRNDAQTNSTYLVLMVLSTMLATVGLYLNSGSVVIGAMLLAPLMTPIVSLAMGLLRHDEKMTSQSTIKITVGVMIALLSSALISLLFPHKPMTNEMLARLSPSLLDLSVAIFAGMAAAYTKSFKEIMQSLAGVAIAVALVPPLAVAGIGLGRLDPYFFAQSFLLFFTNLIGIILASTFTFRVLGYSAAVHGKRSIGLVILMLAMISIPLYLTYHDIVQKLVVEKNWQHERFLVNGKYLIVQKATLIHKREKDVINMEILAREQLNRDDMNLFRKKVQTNFSRKLIIRVNITYIL